MVFKQKELEKHLRHLRPPTPLMAKVVPEDEAEKRYCQEKFFLFWRQLQYPHIVFSNPTSE